MNDKLKLAESIIKCSTPYELGRIEYRFKETMDDWEIILNDNVDAEPTFHATSIVAAMVVANISCYICWNEENKTNELHIFE